jgi:hypothetical protein
MATTVIDEGRGTLLEIAKRLDPDGKLADVAEVLHETNPIVKDLVLKPANMKVANRVTIRTKLPTVAFTRLNKGVPRSKSATKQITDSIGLLAGRSEVDSRAKHVTNVKAYRWDEDQTYLESMAQTMAETIFYGDEASDDSAFTGFHPRFADMSETPTTGYANQVVGAGGTGSDNTSIFVIDHHERYIYGIYPEEGGGVGGLETEDRGMQQVTDDDGHAFDAWVTKYDWALGIVVKDHRHFGRLCNIDVGDLETAGQASGDVSANIARGLIRVLGRMQPANGARRIAYCRQEVLTALEQQLLVRTNVNFSMGEWAGMPVLTFRGIPLVRCDQISIAEPALS